MGGRKFKLSVHRKNEERKKMAKRKSPDTKNACTTSQVVTSPVEPPELSLNISIPLDVFVNGHCSSLDSISNRLLSWMTSARPSHMDSWKIASQDPLVLCKLHIQESEQGSMVEATMTITIDRELKFAVVFKQQNLTATRCPLLNDLPTITDSVSSVSCLLQFLDSTKHWIGNPDKHFIEMWKQRSLTLHGCSGSQCYLDTNSECIRHENCQLLLPSNHQFVRCSFCSTARKTLTTQHSRMKQKKSIDTTSADSHVNYRYQSLPQVVSRLSNVHKKCTSVTKQLEALKKKINHTTEVMGISLDEDSHSDLQTLATDGLSFVKELPPDSCRRIFWEQQLEAASKKKSCGMRWHPLMIRWCLYLRHLSSGAYEALRSSGLQLPSQRTLRDYTHYVEAAPGFSTDVDKMLMEAAKLDTCREREKCVILLLDEMHIREDLVFDKHTGSMIGFAELGKITMHLLEFEHQLQSDEIAKPELAKTMLVLMVRGLFNSLQFAYAQFPCADLSGEMLFEIFWEAVRRIENCGLKVLAATLDGNSVNRRFIKLHDPSAELVYKVVNPYAEDERNLFFFSDPPHLMKTLRNCWQSKHRTLWNNGKLILWSHLVNLYNKDTSSGEGIRMVPKLKLEHIRLTSFSKMRVDLAAQVLSNPVSKALELTGGEEASGTATFVAYCDKWFDIFNVHNYVHGIHSRKESQEPITANNKDNRIDWLKEFVSYLESWETSVYGRDGFTKTEQSNMLISLETRTGLKMNCKSFSELVQN